MLLDNYEYNHIHFLDEETKILRDHTISKWQNWKYNSVWIDTRAVTYILSYAVFMLNLHQAHNSGLIRKEDWAMNAASDTS